MTKSILFLFSALLLTFSACKKKEAAIITNPVSGSEATISWEECAEFTDHNLTICFVGANEYRCPCDAMCIWEGAVDATLHVTSTTGIDTTITLTTNSNPNGLQLHNKETIGGKTIRFVNTAEVTPDDCANYANYEKYKVIISVE